MKCRIHTFALVVIAAVALTNTAQAGEPWLNNYGLGTIVHPIQEPAAPAAPADASHIHIFAVDGFNPGCFANFNGMCGYIRQHGYPNCNFGQLQNSGDFVARIRQVRQEDPQARIALIGYSFGANYVKSVAHDLAYEGSKVDLLVYLAADFVSNSSDARPKNVNRLVNIRVKGIALTGGDYYFNNQEIAGARNVKLDCRHLMAPSRHETIELIMEELAALGEPAKTSTSAKPANDTLPAKPGKTVSTLRIP